jgi:hypothetical protein
MKTQGWNFVLALAFCFIAPGSALSGPTSTRPTTEHIAVTRPIAWASYTDNSYDYTGGIASWDNVGIFQNRIYYLSSPVFGPWPEKAGGRYSLMGEKILYSIRGERGWPKYSIWGDDGWPGLDLEQRLLPSLQVKNEYVN